MEKDIPVTELIKEQECNEFVEKNFNAFIMLKAYEIWNLG